MPKPAEKAPSYRDKFRAATLGSNSTRTTETITIERNGEPLQVVLKTPSFSGQEAAYEAAGMKFSGGKGRIAHPLRFQIEMIILCCFTPQFGPNGEVTGPGEPLFTSADREQLMDEALAGWLKDLSEAVTRFNKEKPLAAAKNSEATPADSSVSP